MRVKSKPQKAEVRPLQGYMTCTWHPYTVHYCRYKYLFEEQERQKALEVQRFLEEGIRLRAMADYQERINRIIFSDSKKKSKKKK